MLFSSMLFLWVFLPAVIALNFIAIKLFGVKGSNVILLLSSMLFYAWGEPIYILLMLFSITFNWIMGCALGKLENESVRKGVLALSVIVNLLLLGFFKYIPLVADIAGALFHTHIERSTIPSLPIGISFYTFQAIEINSLLPKSVLLTQIYLFWKQLNAMHQTC